MTAQGTVRGSLAPLLLLAAVLAGLAFIAGAPFLQLLRLDEAMAGHQAKLADLRRQISSQAELRQENEELAALGQEKRLLLEGGTTGIAGATLQKLMNDVVLLHGGAASSFQILPPKQDGAVTRIAMSLVVSVDIDGLRNILFDIETGAPLVFIDAVTIRVPNQGEQAADPHFLGPFDVTLRVSSFVLRGGAS